MEVVVGGIIPNEDAERLLELGVRRVFGPGTPLDISLTGSQVKLLIPSAANGRTGFWGF